MWKASCKSKQFIGRSKNHVHRASVLVVETHTEVAIQTFSIEKFVFEKRLKQTRLSIVHNSLEVFDVYTKKLLKFFPIVLFFVFVFKNWNSAFLFENSVNSRGCDHQMLIAMRHLNNAACVHVQSGVLDVVYFHAFYQQFIVAQNIKLVCHWRKFQLFFLLILIFHVKRAGIIV